MGEAFGGSDDDGPELPVVVETEAGTPISSAVDSVASVTSVPCSLVVAVADGSALMSTLPSISTTLETDVGCLDAGAVVCILGELVVSTRGVNSSSRYPSSKTSLRRSSSVSVGDWVTLSTGVE